MYANKILLLNEGLLARDGVVLSAVLVRPIHDSGVLAIGDETTNH